MKVHTNTQLSIILGVLIVLLSCLNIHPFRAAAQSITTASPSTSASAKYPMPPMPPPQPYPGSSQIYTPSVHTMGNGMSMADMSPDEYWKEVAGEPFKFTGKIRTYYIASDEVVWDYAPEQFDKALNREWTEVAKEYVVSTPTRVGSKYYKCLYKEYTNAKFNVLKARAKEDEYLGFLGPVIRAEVGDIIKVVFLNRCPFSASVRPHGVFYDKANEGDPYNDGTTGTNRADDEVLPGKSFTYTWNVPERAGPGPMDGSSVMWMYHSRTRERGEFYAGLHGPIAITRKGMAKADGSPMDVDREIFQMYSVTNENNSPYLNKSFYAFSKAKPTDPLPTDPGFVPSNQKHGINGFMYGNGAWVTIKKNARARWYLMSMGTFFDGHTPHWHGNTVLTSGMRMDVVSMLAAEMVIADMCPENVGKWLYHCHVNDHFEEGMVSVFEVLEDKTKKPW